MKINRKLNFVIPIYDDPIIIKEDGKEKEIEKIAAYVHSTPIGREVFERYFLVLAKTFSAIYGEGLGFIAGPRIAGMLLKKTATELNDWEGSDGAQAGLIGEMHRLTNLLIPNGKGWEMVPFEDAIKKGMINDEDAAEVENALTFFIVNSAMHKKEALRISLEGAAKLWGAQITPLNVTEFLNSLPTSMPTDNFGEKVTPLSIPR